MIHRRIILVAVVLAAGLLLMISSMLVLAATTAFSHGFEDSEGGVGNWEYTYSGVTYGISTTNPSAHSGSQSAWVRHSRTTASGIQNAERFSATAGHNYTFGGWVYVSDSGEGLNVEQAFLKIGWYTIFVNLSWRAALIPLAHQSDSLYQLLEKGQQRCPGLAE